MSEELLDGFRIGPYKIFPRRQRIEGPKETINIEPKVMQVLVTLAANPKVIISKNEMLDQVWKDTVVGEEVVTRAISLLRKYFNDSVQNPEYIRTLPKLGYELITDVQGGTGTFAPSRKIPLFPALAAALLLVITVGAAMRFWPSSAPTDLTLAVMPLSVSGQDPKLAYMADGLADHLITHLTQSPSLNVVARRSSFLIRDTEVNVRAIGEQLGARYIVEGSLANRESDLLLTLYVVDTELGTNLWTTQILGPDNNLANLQLQAQNALSQGLADELHINIGGSTTSGSRDIPEAAFLKYHEAKYQWSLRGEPRIARAIGLLEEAINLAPNFAAAHMALAQTVAVQPFYSDDPVAERFTLARASATRALQIDPSLGADAAALEGFLLHRERRWLEAEASLIEALRIDNNHINAQYWYSWLLTDLGKYDQALEHLLIAWDLNPVSALLNDRLAIAHLWVNDLEGAAERYQAAVDFGYLESTQPLSRILFMIRTEQFDQVQALFERMGFADVWVQPLVQGLRDPEARAEGILAVEAAHAAGTIPFEYLFGIWVLYQDVDRAFRDFDSGPKTKYVGFLWAQEAEILRRDARFSALLKSLNLTDLVDPARSS